MSTATMDYAPPATVQEPEQLRGWLGLPLGAAGVLLWILSLRPLFAHGE